MRMEIFFCAHRNKFPCARKFDALRTEILRRGERAEKTSEKPRVSRRTKVSSDALTPLSPQGSPLLGMRGIQRMASESAFASCAGAKRHVCPGRMRSRLPGISLTMVGSESDMASYKGLGLPTLLALRGGGLRAGRPNHVLPERQENRSKWRTMAETPDA